MFLLNDNLNCLIYFLKYIIQPYKKLFSKEVI